MSIDGSVIQIDRGSNADYYRSPGPGAPPVVPPSAQQLVNLIAQYTGAVPPESQLAGAAEEGPAFQPTVAKQYAQDEATAVREELARFAPQLYELLDPTWQSYLALPAEIFNGAGQPSPQAMADCLARFQAVQKNPRYASLAERPEFQTVYGLLRHYSQALAGEQQTLSLPAPPPAP